MVEDDFLKEKQNIREKMLKYSRAIKEGRPYEEYEQNFNESDRILKNRIQRKKRPKFTDFDEEYEEKPRKQSAIYLKEDLINVKLEEKKPFKLQLNFFKKQKEKFDKKNIANSKTLKSNKSTQEVRKIEKKQENKDPIQISKILTQSNVFVTSKFQDLKEKRKEKAKLKQELKEQKKIEQEKLRKAQEELKEKEKLAKQEQKILEEKVRLEENQEYNQEDKYELLDSIVSEENKNLSPKNLIYAGLMIAFALLIFFPQIYIRNQIYYVSRDIADLRSQELVLDEENKELQRQLEALYFQNQVLDFLD
ncbi:hypothetical protein HW242_07715 [Campylobacter lari]|uniref:Transmembrane protein n=1 Tax=Campylobacter lari TaxID=201 RepID=A0A7M1MF34_CAMLA|nr:hypothetical protein [Campylobacter sp. IFREMER_LSEM_CL2256]EGK8010182.1 hypothetical protein [Campylobacter lari]MCV3387511.1 hypothetical protein [Campylobacter sp. IFREMER_LSEM_CL2256]QOQ99578.1 hypothetical protein HW242_07715 [Campylobacter lari]